jgi:hypothetical protein
MSLKNRIRGYIIEQHHDFGGRLTAKDIISFLEVEKIHYTQRNVKGILQKLVEEEDFIQGRRCSEINPNHDGQYQYNEICYYCSGELNEAPPITDPIIALLLVMVNSHLKPLLPSRFSDYIEEAEYTLNRSDAYKNWTKKIESSPLPYEQSDPSDEPNTVDAIYHALLKGWVFYAKYLGSAHDYNQYGKWVPKNIKIDESNVKVKRYHPLGLILRGQIIYLVAMCDDPFNPDISTNKTAQHFAVHKFREVEVLEQDVQINNTVFKEYIENCVIDEPINPELGHNTGIKSIEKIHLVLKVSEAVAQYFKEDVPYGLEIIDRDGEWDNMQMNIYALHSNPDELIGYRDSWPSFSAEGVPDTEQLRRWISSLQPNVEVLQPDYLREYFRNIARQSSSIYK